MKTIADLKRRLTVGTVVVLFDSNYPHVARDRRRTVVEAKSTGVQLSEIPGLCRASWLDFPKRVKW